MDIEQLEQLAAVIVTAGLVAGNFLLFTPWRDGYDPRQRHPESSIPSPPGTHQLIALNAYFNPQGDGAFNPDGEQRRRDQLINTGLSRNKFSKTGKKPTRATAEQYNKDLSQA